MGFIRVWSRSSSSRYLARALAWRLRPVSSRFTFRFYSFFCSSYLADLVAAMGRLALIGHGWGILIGTFAWR